MVASALDNKSLFIKCKQSVLEIVGWRSFIFLPQNFVWRFFIILTVMLSVMLNMTFCAYHVDAKVLDLIRLSCDIAYFVDTVLATLHYAMRETRKLKYGRKRSFLLLLLDYLSLLPLTIIFSHSNYLRENDDSSLNCYLHVFEFLRVYQIPRSFWNMKNLIYKVKTYITVTFFEVLSYFTLLTYVFGCFLAMHFEEDQEALCQEDVVMCIFSNFSITFCIFSQLFITPFKNYSAKNQGSLMVVFYLVGYLFTYAYLLPLALFMCYKYLVKSFKSSVRWIHLKIFLRNMIKDKKLKEKILKQLHYTWTYGKGDQWPDVLTVIPLGLRKNIFCDMHWEAIKHSKLFRDLSMGFKRSLALYMTTEFIIPETTLIKKAEKNYFFMYLESGLMQIMSSENSESPVINLSSGTVLGEISFFLQTESKATLRVAQLSAVHLLHFRNFYRVLADYPDDRKLVFENLNARLNFAKSMYRNKTVIGPQFFSSEEVRSCGSLLQEGNVKWLKEQSRALFEIKKAEKLAKVNFTKESIHNYKLRLQKLKTQLEHTSLHLPHINIHHAKVNKFDNVCLKPSFPWMLNPQSHFFSIWNPVVFICVMFIAVFYPGILGWSSGLPDWFFNISVVVSLVNITDVLLQLATAVKLKNVVLCKFFEVFTYRLNSPTFWVDVIAALPFQFLLTDTVRNKAFAWNLYFINVFLKTYLLFSTINRWTYSHRSGAFVRVCLKYCFYFMMFLVWAATTFNYVVGDWDIYKGTEWYDSIEKKTDLPLSVDASLIKALFSVLKIPGSDFENEIFKLFFFSFFFNNFFHFYFIIVVSESIAAYIIESTYELEYKKLMKFVYEFMEKKNLTRRLKTRVLDMMKFQLYYEKGGLIIKRSDIIDNVLIDLKKEIIEDTLVPVLGKSKLFESENKIFQFDLCRAAVPLVLPKDSVLVTFGTKPMSLFLVQKGFIQINSFVVGDVRMNISTPVVIEEGAAFPVVDAFFQSPAAVSAVAITDCKLVRIDLEDILTGMIIHGILKDLVEAVIATDLSPLSSAKLAISSIKENFMLGKKSHEVVFKRFKYLRIALRVLLRKKAINSQSKWYVQWEFARCLILLCSLFCWPIVFGFSAESHNLFSAIAALFAVDCIFWVDFYIRLHAAYYNKIGICVTHTWYTSWHYLTTSFIADFMAYFPSFHISWWLFNRHYDFEFQVVIIHLLLRSISIYRIIGFLSYLNQKKNLYFNVKLVQVFLFALLLVHYYVNLQLYIFFKRTLDFPEEDKSFEVFFKYYMYELGQVVSMILKNVHQFEDFKLLDLVLSVLFALFGYFLRIYIYGNITLLSIATERRWNFYQYHMKSFIEYLTIEKANERILSVVAEYYKNDWEMYEGFNWFKIFSHFPRTLHEDITYPMYKDTFNAIPCFSKANESFLRMLARNVQEINLQKGTVIFYKKQVHKDIFFIHKGSCTVENENKTLCKGSMMGDFQKSRVMKNTISTKTSVQLLRISSETFFMAINNFHYTRMAFQAETASGDNFISSIYIEEELKSADPFFNELHNENSKFISGQEKQYFTESLSLSMKQLILNPESLAAYVLDYASLFVVYATLFLIPTFVVFRMFSMYYLGIIYFLDATWVIKIILNMRTAYYDERGGFYVYDKKAIKRRYLRLFDGFVTHFLSVVPFEIIPFIYFGFRISDECCAVMSFFYVNRLLRGTFLITAKKQDKSKLLTNFSKGLAKVLITKFIFINFCVSFHMILKDYKKNLFSRCNWNIQPSHLDAIITSYHWVLNINVEHHAGSHQSDQYIQSFLRLVLSVCSFLSKVFLLNEVLVIMFVKHQIKSDEMLKLEHLEDFLLVNRARNVSPILFKRTKEYFCHLLNSFNETAEPLYLRNAPPVIRGKIMHKFYMHHFFKCYPFRTIDYNFVKQLAERLERCIYFPGDYITEKGDVDHNMYFIHKGEIYCIEKDKSIKDLEEPIDLYVTGENFGVLQGTLRIYPHTYTYRAKTVSDVLVLNYYKWEDLREAFPDVTKIIYKRCMEYKNSLKNPDNRKRA